MKALTRLAAVVMAAIAAITGAGCSSVGVEVWQRDVLARAEMHPDHRAADRGLDDHIYFSKEAASGGRGFGGGGCGCN